MQAQVSNGWTENDLRLQRRGLVPIALIFAVTIVLMLVALL
mgnify:CR=1 FL=1